MKIKLVGGLGMRVQETREGWTVTRDARRVERHPWEPIPRYDFERGVWRFAFWPGFVNGEEAVVKNPEAREDWDGPEEYPAMVPLTDLPEVEFGGWLAPGRAGSGGFTDSGVALVEGFPKWFERIGVRRAEKPGPGFGSLTQEGTEVEIGVEEPDYGTREIRSAEVWLWHERPSVVVTNNAGVVVDGSLLEWSYELGAGSATFREPFEVRIMGRHAPSPEPGMLDRLNGNFVENPWDNLRLGKVYAVSPPDPDGKLREAMPDGSWEIYAKPEVWWNLQHARARYEELEFTPIRIFTGLGFGMLDLLGNAALSGVNEALERATLALNRTTLAGKFWT